MQALTVRPETECSRVPAISINCTGLPSCSSVRLQAKVSKSHTCAAMTASQLSASATYARYRGIAHAFLGNRQGAFVCGSCGNCAQPYGCCTKTSQFSRGRRSVYMQQRKLHMYLNFHVCLNKDTDVLRSKQRVTLMVPSSEALKRRRSWCTRIARTGPR